MSLEKIRGRLKLTPLTLLLSLFALVAIAYIALVVSFLQQRRDEDALSSQIDLASGVLAAAEGSRQELEDLQARLQAAEQELALARSAYPSEIDSSAVVETVLARANESRVRVLSASTEAPVDQTDGESQYRVLSATFDVEGGLGDLIAFLAALEKGAGGTGIKSLSMEESAGGYTLSLELLAYASQAADKESGAETAGATSGAAPATTGDDKDRSGE